VWVLDVGTEYVLGLLFFLIVGREKPIRGRNFGRYRTGAFPRAIFTLSGIGHLLLWKRPQAATAWV
jgi:hypothetical protein